MSYIDTFDHEFVGFFAGLPLYHPLEAVAGTNVIGEFACTPEHLVLGGGDGEHPALVLVDPNSAVLHFLRMSLRIRDEGEEVLSESVLAAIDNASPASQCVRYADWDLDTYVDFYKRCTTASFPAPFSQKVHGSLEDWIVGSLGEFTYFSMPELAREIIQQLSEMHRLVLVPILFNVTTVPPGYLVATGRITLQSGEVKWGNYRWEDRTLFGNG